MMIFYPRSSTGSKLVVKRFLRKSKEHTDTTKSSESSEVTSSESEGFKINDFINIFNSNIKGLKKAINNKTTKHDLDRSPITEKNKYKTYKSQTMDKKKHKDSSSNEDIRATEKINKKGNSNQNKNKNPNKEKYHLEERSREISRIKERMKSKNRYKGKTMNPKRDPEKMQEAFQLNEDVTPIPTTDRGKNMNVKKFLPNKENDRNKNENQDKTSKIGGNLIGESVPGRALNTGMKLPVPSVSKLRSHQKKLNDLRWHDVIF